MKFKFRKGASASYSDDDFYALTNGYLDPAEILENPEAIRAVQEAADLLERFFSEGRDCGAIEEM